MLTRSMVIHSINPPQCNGVNKTTKVNIADVKSRQTTLIFFWWWKRDTIKSIRVADGLLKWFAGLAKREQKQSNVFTIF